MRLLIEHMANIIFKHPNGRLLQKLSNNTTVFPYHYNDLTESGPGETGEMPKSKRTPSQKIRAQHQIKVLSPQLV